MDTLVDANHLKRDLTTVSPTRISTNKTLTFTTLAILFETKDLLFSEIKVWDIVVNPHMNSIGKKCVCACAKTPLTQFDGKGDHLMHTPIHTRFIPDAYPAVVM